MTAPTIQDLIDRNHDLFSAMEREQNGWSQILAGRIDDPDSYDANGGRVGPLGYYPLTDANGVVQYRPCLARLREIAASVPPTDYVSRAAASQVTVPATVVRISVAGIASANDGGSASYKRVASQPSHSGFFRDASNAVWELDEHESRPEYFGYDIATTDDAKDAAIEAANFYAYRTGRRLLFRGKKEYVVRALKLYSGVTYDGAGSVQGSKAETLETMGAATIKRAPNSTTKGTVIKGSNKSTGWQLRNLNIDGNRANNASGHGIYIYAPNDGERISGETSENSYIDCVVIRDAKEDGLFISGDLSYYNIVQVNIGQLLIRMCEGYGCNSQTWTDSSINTIVISGCGIGAWRSNSWANNHVSGVIKGFYNGWRLGGAGVGARDMNNTSFKFFDSGRGFWRFEAQEEYVSGFYFGNCYEFQAQILADANGFPPGGAVPGPIAARGCQFHNCSHFSVDYIADSFHAKDATPFLQDQPLALSSSSDGVVPDGIFINAVYRNQRQMAITKAFSTATVGRVTIIDNGSLDTYNGSQSAGAISIANDKNFNRRSSFRGFVDTGDNDVLQIDVGGAGATGKSVDFFRRTQASGSRSIRILRGDGTSTLDHRITAAGSLEVSLFQGGVWNLGHLTLGPWHIWVDGNGCLRQKNGAPTSAFDGSVIGQVLTTVPTGPSAKGITGQTSFDDDYFYMCVGKDRWKRLALPAAW